MFRLSTMIQKIIPLFFVAIPTVLSTTIEYIAYILISHLLLPANFAMWIMEGFFCSIWAVVLWTRLSKIRNPPTPPIPDRIQSTKPSPFGVIYPEYPGMWMYKGTADQFMCTQWPYSGTREAPERIIHSAIRHPDGTIYSVQSPGRHHHCIGLMARYGTAGTANTRNQGFITNFGRYVDRIEGLAIAIKADQIIRKTGSAHLLFSDDIWLTPQPIKEQA